MRFKFTVREILERDVVVEAPNAEEAENVLEKEWSHSDKFMLPEDCMSDIHFICEGETDEKADYQYKPEFRVLMPGEVPED